jgi:alpha-tubulin suppressor-like RCC1 family protein
MALKDDGTVWAWGDNSKGQLGDGTTTDRHTAVQVEASENPTVYLQNVVDIAAGKLHSLAAKSDGSAWAWGEGTYGKLGNNSSSNSSLPVRVQDPLEFAGCLQDVVGVSAGDQHSLALKDDGTVWAWGNNSSGQLGDGTTTNRDTATQVVASENPTVYLQNVVDIAAGGFHSLAVKSDETAWAWGLNRRGPLGDGSTDDSELPVQVQDSSGDFENVVDVSAGQQHSLAVKDDDTLWGWGANEDSQLGDGSTTNRYTAISIMNLY